MNIWKEYLYDISLEKSAEIIRYNGNDEMPDIPNEIENYPVKIIKENAFAGTDISEISIPEGIEILEPQAFAVCDSLLRVSLPSSLEEIGSGVFKGSKNLRVIEFPNGNEEYYVEDGILYNNQERALVICPPGLRKEFVSVPMGIEVVSQAAFYLNRLLKHVHLPTTLKRIDSEAFLFTDSLEMIELPPDLEIIESDSFLLFGGKLAEKRFDIYAFPNSIGYQYALDNNIQVHPLYAIVTD